MKKEEAEEEGVVAVPEPAPPAAAAAVASVAAKAKEEVDAQEWMPTPQMEEMIVVFLIRMVFVAVGEGKDKESAVCQAASQDLVTEVLKVRVISSRLGTGHTP